VDPLYTRYAWRRNVSACGNGGVQTNSAKNGPNDSVADYCRGPSSEMNRVPFDEFNRSLLMKEVIYHGEVKYKIKRAAHIGPKIPKCEVFLGSYMQCTAILQFQSASYADYCKRSHADRFKLMRRPADQTVTTRLPASIIQYDTMPG
jgi:hypothetical protein